MVSPRSALKASVDEWRLLQAAQVARRAASAEAAAVDLLDLLDMVGSGYGIAPKGFGAFSRYNFAVLHAARGGRVTSAPTSDLPARESAAQVHKEQMIWSKLFDKQNAVDNPEGSSSSSSWQGI